MREEALRQAVEVDSRLAQLLGEREEIERERRRLSARERALDEKQAARQRELDRKAEAWREGEAQRQAVREAQAKVQMVCFSFPPHWSATAGETSESALSLVHVKDRGVRAALQACMEGTGIGLGGRDQRLAGQYSKLVLKEAWRVENTGHTPNPKPYKSYTLHPTPYALHPSPSTLHPSPNTLHPAPYTLH